MAEKPRPIEPEFFQALGQIVTRWAFVEMLVTQFFAYVLRADRGYVYLLTQTVAGATVIGWIRTALPLRFSDQAQIRALTELLNRIDDVRRERNALVHGVWNTNTVPGTVTVQTVNYARTEIIKNEIKSLADLHELDSEIMELVGILRDLGKGLGF